MTHEQLRRSLASYVLGALAPPDRRQLDEHLLGCPECREELASYAVLPGLLSRLDLAEATAGTLLPPPSLLPATLAAVQSERAARVRQVSRWRLATAAVAVAAAATGVLVVTADAVSPPPRRPLVAVAGVGSSGSVSLQPRPWGTELHLQLRDLPPADGFEAYAVDDAGTRTLAASWGSTADGRAAVPAATRLSSEALSRLVVQTRGGQELLVLEG